jgi:uncharacterized membrane protein YjgN (DUF898 family)
MDTFLDLEAAEEFSPLKSGFDGNRGIFILYSAAKFLTTILSATLLYPLVTFLFDRWETLNRRVDGKPLTFDGKIYQAYGIYFSGLIFIALVGLVINYASKLSLNPFIAKYLPVILNALNAGLGTIFIESRMQKWKARHTFIEGEGGRSALKKNILWVGGISILTSLLSILSVGIVYPLSFAMQAAYYTEVTDISDKNLMFTGKIKDAYSGYFISILLCIVTLGVYIFAVNYSLTKWQYENCRFE